MLLRFSVSNFRALRELETLNLTAKGADKGLPENVLPDEILGLKDQRWLKGAAIYGANASGKSTVIEAIETLATWVKESARTIDPEEAIDAIEPFALDPSAAEEPTAFGIVFVSEEVRFEYRVAATRDLIYHESLRAWPHGKEQIWFERDWNEDSKSHDFSPENPTGLSRHRDIEQRALRNVLYLSKAVAENRKELQPVYRWFSNSIKFLDLSTRSGVGGGFTLKQIDQRDSVYKSRILTALRHADLGIVDASVVDHQPDDDLLKLLQTVDPESLPAKGKGKTRFVQPQLVHRGPRDGAMALAWERESAGTHRFFALIGPILDILKKGHTVCIDEVETSMHPSMVRELLKLFFSSEENTSGAQIIFTTHNPLLLDGSLLRRDQVWFTDKDKEGVSHLYPLTDHQPRKGESLIRGYMAGRYGAIPFVPDGLLGMTGSGKDQEREEVAHD